MTERNVGPGMTSSGLVETSGNDDRVYGGGFTSGTIVSSGGFEYVSAGGSTDGTIAAAGGTQIVFAGGIASATNLAAASDEDGSGGPTIAGDGTQVVSAGGLATYTTVGDMGFQTISSGGSATFALVSGGFEGQQIVLSGGYASGTTVIYGGSPFGGGQLVSAGGSAFATVLTSGGAESVFGLASGTQVLDRSAENIYSGGRAVDTTASAGGVYVYSGGTTSGTVLSQGGAEYVFSSGVSLNTLVTSGASEIVSNGGVASAASLTSGALELLSSGAFGGAAAVGAGATQFVYSGGEASETIVSSGGTEFVIGGGSASDTVVGSGGLLVELPGAAVTGASGAGRIVTTGVVYVADGQGVAAPVTSGVTLSGNDLMDVLAGGSALGTNLDGGSQVVFAGGATSGTVAAGGYVAVLSGASTTGTSIYPGGGETVFSGARAIGSMLSGGAANQYVSSGGVASGTILTNGGQETTIGTASGAVVLGGGLEAIELGGTSYGITVSNGGQEGVYSSSTAFGTTVSSGGFLTVHTGGLASGAMVEEGGTELLLSGGTASGTTISNGASIDVSFLAFSQNGSASIDDGDMLTINEGGMTYTQQLAGDYAGESVALSQDISSGTLATVTCFTTGTRIRTIRNRIVFDIPVEQIVVGDVALTACEAMRPIRWIGHRTIDKPTLDQCPVRIRAGAFGAGLPERELRLSPGHPVLVGANEDREGGHLVPIMCLINGTTVERMPVVEVTYWHVELDSHDVLLAEGLPAESYLDWGDRAFFTESNAHALANPDFVMPGLTGRCRPVVLDGHVVEHERRRLDAVFSSKLASSCLWPSIAAGDWPDGRSAYDTHVAAYFRKLQS